MHLYSFHAAAAVNFLKRSFASVWRVWATKCRTPPPPQRCLGICLCFLFCCPVGWPFWLCFSRKYPSCDAMVLAKNHLAEKQKCQKLSHGIASLAEVMEADWPLFSCMFCFNDRKDHTFKTSLWDTMSKGGRLDLISWRPRTMGNSQVLAIGARSISVFPKELMLPAPVPTFWPAPFLLQSPPPVLWVL